MSTFNDNQINNEMYRQQFWSLRQNPYANTNQRQMRELIISQNIKSFFIIFQKISQRLQVYPQKVENFD